MRRGRNLDAVLLLAAAADIAAGGIYGFERSAGDVLGIGALAVLSEFTAILVFSQQHPGRRKVSGQSVTFDHLHASKPVHEWSEAPKPSRRHKIEKL